MPQHDQFDPVTSEALRAALFAITQVLVPSFRLVPDGSGGLSINMEGHPETCVRIWDDGSAEFFRFQDGVFTDRRECKIPIPEWALG